MKNIRISDITLASGALSFREKLEIAKLLDKTGVSVVNFGKITDEKVDLLALRTLCSTFENATFACTVGADCEETAKVAEALSGAKRSRLVVSLPTSSVQMEYTYAKKPADMAKLISQAVSCAASHGMEVEFEALDASRAEEDFLCDAVNGAISAGATVITLCDTAGNTLPSEFGAFIKNLFEKIPALKNVSVGALCSNSLKCANASLIEALAAGATEARVSALSKEIPTIKDFSDILSAKGASLGICNPINTMTIGRTCEEISCLVCEKKSGSAFDNRVGASAIGISLGADTDIVALRAAVEELGYELSDDDMVKIYKKFEKLAAKKLVTSRDLDAIVASSSLSAPPVYRLVNYTITSGNLIGSTARIVLEKENVQLTGLSEGNGPIDASFLALEKITGHHFELDDFQIQSVTEGRNAVGEAIVRLRSSGKLYSGKGSSTDIVGASINAYINALNKIVYDENR